MQLEKSFFIGGASKCAIFFFFLDETNKSAINCFSFPFSLRVDFSSLFFFSFSLMSLFFSFLGIYIYIYIPEETSVNFAASLKKDSFQVFCKALLSVNYLFDAFYLLRQHENNCRLHFNYVCFYLSTINQEVERKNIAF